MLALGYDSRTVGTGRNSQLGARVKRHCSTSTKSDPPDDLLALALEVGCLFAVDSDAHAPGQLDFKALGCERAERLGVPAERIVNTWDADRLVKWAGGAG